MTLADPESAQQMESPMNGITRQSRRLSLALVASCVLSLGVSSGSASAESAPKSRLSVASVAQTIGQERATFKAGAARIAALSQAARKRPAADDDSLVTVGARNVDPGTAVKLAAAGTRPLDLAAIDALPRVQGGADWQCLAEAIYFESRGEPLAGQIAVAEVVLNRVDDRRYPRTVCGVTRQGSSGRGCQFSYACDGRSDAMTSRVSRERSEKIATLMIAGRPRTVTDGATHFHAHFVRPGWAGKMTRTAKIGHHSFYRSGTRVAQR